MEYAKYLALPPLKITKSENSSDCLAGLICEGKILEIDKYSCKELVERWFFDNSYAQLKWFKYDVKNNKRSSRENIYSRESTYYWSYPLVSKHSENIVNKFLRVTDGLKSLHALQKKIINRKKDENEEFVRIINNKIDTLPTPQGLEDWIRSKVINGDRYIFYKYKKEYGIGIGGERENLSHYDGYCTRCNQYFQFWDKPVHNEATFCPMCGEATTYKADGLSRKALSHVANIAFPQSVDGENFVVRCFHITRDYTGKYENIQTELKEFARYYFTKDRVWFSKNEMKYGMFNGYIEGLKYFQLTNKFSIFDGAYWFYDDVLPEVLNRSYLSRQQGIIQDFCIQSQKCYKVNLWDAHIELLRYLSTYPAIEYLLRLKLFGLVYSVLSGEIVDKSPLSLKGKTADNVLGMSITTLKQFNGYEMMRIKELRTAQYCIANKLMDCYEWINNEGYNAIVNLEKISKIVPLRKVINYIRNYSVKIGLNDYYDYISGCASLNYDLNDTMILKPRDFKTAHDNITVLLKVQENRILDISIQTAYEAYSKLVEWTDGKTRVLMAKDSEDIIREGQTQNHCVGRYCERVAKGESLILFLRKVSEPDKGYYTMEIRPDMRKLNNVQCRGYGNADQSEEVAKFISRYEKWFNRRPSKGFEPSKVMAKYYKAVIKTSDGRYISAADAKTEFKINEQSETEIDTNPDNVAVKGLHIASLEFAQGFGNQWHNVAILEVEVNLNDVIVPNAVDQIRTSKFKVLREVPMGEMGDWGAQHM